jgi:uncharacterized protein
MTPTQMARADRCLHAWHLECHGDPAWKTEPSAGTRLLWERGNEHERQMIALLPSCVEPQWEHPDWEAGLAATVALMKEGVPWIYQAPLFREDVYGKPDLLERIEVPSLLGDHSYRPVDVKGHKEVKRKDRIQLAAYSWMLEPLLGQRPDEGAIWLNTGAQEPVELARLVLDFDELHAAMGRVRDEPTDSAGYRCSECGLCDWSDYCWQQWQETDSVCLVRSVTGDTARVLVSSGVDDFRKLAALRPSELSERFGFSFYKAETMVQHAKARVLGKPIYKAYLPDHADRTIIHYDIETYGQTVYLHGILVCQGKERAERSFLARHPDQERQVWHELLDFLSKFPDAVVYNWADYERGHANRLWEDHGGNPDGWRLLDQQMFDLCQVVKETAVLPVATYSIKEVAPVFGFEWQAEDAGGLNSEAWYGEWLRDGDEGVLEKIAEYNLDDVRGMGAIWGELNKPTMLDFLNHKSNSGR